MKVVACLKQAKTVAVGCTPQTHDTLAFTCDLLEADSQ